MCVLNRTREISNGVAVKKLMNSASDHFPLIITYASKRDKKCYSRSITKRSLKKFNNEDWNNVLQSKDWSSFHNTDDVDTAVSIYTSIVESALYELAPLKTFKIKSRYKFGLSDKTKKLMKERDYSVKREIKKYIVTLPL